LIAGTLRSAIRRIADAILDRLVHNTYRINLSGDSMRNAKRV
jgi:DNA replication protein DnaC